MKNGRLAGCGNGRAFIYKLQLVANEAQEDVEAICAHDSFRAKLCWTESGVHVSIDSVVSQYRNDMNSKNSPENTCPIARSLAFLGDAWTMLILRDANAGLTRFDQFKKSLGIAPTMLTKRLATLTEEQMLEKRQYSERPPRDEYILTQAGRDYLPVLFMIAAWGQKHRGDGKLIRFLDAETGTDLKPIAIDAETGAEIGTREIRMVMPE